MTYYIAYYRKSHGYIDEEAGVRQTEIESADEAHARVGVKNEDSFCSFVLYVRTEGHRALTEDERERVSEYDMGEACHGGGYGYNDPKDEPREL